MSDQSAATDGALSDVRVVEFAQALAIPYCGKLLGDMGADVVKVEPPRGDTYRLQSRSPVKHEGKDFAIANRGKRSICLDFSKPGAAAVIEALARWADVVLVSMKGSDLPRYGLDYDTIRSYNDEIVFLHNSPYGSEGELAEMGGYDVVAMGLSGMSSLLADADTTGDAPVMVRPALADMVTGMLSCLAVVTAIRHRDRTGEGQRVETSLFHTSLGLLSNMFYRYEAYDREPMAAFAEKLAHLRQAGAGFEQQKRAMREEFAVDPPGNIYFRHYRTSDGFLSVGCLTPVLNQKLRDVLGVEDPRRAEGFEAGTPTARAALDEFMAEAERIVATRTTADWLATLRAVGVPCANVNFPHEIFDDPQARANGYIEDLVHPVHGAYQTVSSPLKMDATPLRHHGPSPALGAHTDAVLREIGFDERTVESLRESAVVGRFDETKATR